MSLHGTKQTKYGLKSRPNLVSFVVVTDMLGSRPTSRLMSVMSYDETSSSLLSYFAPSNQFDITEHLTFVETE